MKMKIFFWSHNCKNFFCTFLCILDESNIVCLQTENFSEYFICLFCLQIGWVEYLVYHKIQSFSGILNSLITIFFCIFSSGQTWKWVTLMVNQIFTRPTGSVTIYMMTVCRILSVGLWNKLLVQAGKSWKILTVLLLLQPVKRKQVCVCHLCQFVGSGYHEYDFSEDHRQKSSKKFKK